MEKLRNSEMDTEKFTKQKILLEDEAAKANLKF